MVRRLVEQENVGLGEEDPRQFDPPPLAPRHGAHRLGHFLVADTDRRPEPARLGLGSIAAGHLKLVFEPGVSTDEPIPFFAIGAFDRPPGRFHPALHPADVAGTQDPFEAGGVGVVELGQRRLLREVSDHPGTGDRARHRFQAPGERAQQGRLARAVAADEADLVPRMEGE